MFYSFYNYTKLFCWISLFFVNFKIYGRCNLDILQILLRNIQKTSSLGTKCIQKITPYMKMTNCDEKIINILNSTYENNEYHDDEFTIQTFYNDFNIKLSEKYEIIEKISSGSIGQVYKIKGIKDNKFYAMKVVHPFIKRQIGFIKKIINLFDLNRYTFFELDIFIKNYEKETNFIHEAYNMKNFYKFYKNNERIIIPKLYDFSENIIIMEYIEGVNIESLSDYEKGKYTTFGILFCNNNKAILNFNHGDMHYGNFKKYKENSIIIYDFGFCYDIEDVNIVDALENCWHSLLNHKEAKESFNTSMKYIIKYHGVDGDINRYDDLITEIFLSPKVRELDILFKKIYIFFKKINVRIKMEFLNLMLIYIHTAKYDECEMHDLLAFCEYYNIFNEYVDLIKNNIHYRGTNLKKYTNDINIMDDLKKLI